MGDNKYNKSEEAVDTTSFDNLKLTDDLETLSESVKNESGLVKAKSDFIERRFHKSERILSDEINLELTKISIPEETIVVKTISFSQTVVKFKYPQELPEFKHEKVVKAIHEEKKNEMTDEEKAKLEEVRKKREEYRIEKELEKKRKEEEKEAKAKVLLEEQLSKGDKFKPKGKNRKKR